jgi:hypothetical protein
LLKIICKWNIHGWGHISEEIITDTLRKPEFQTQQMGQKMTEEDKEGKSS